MKKLMIVLGIIMVLSFSCLSGCMDEKSRFIGTWQTPDGSTSMTFNSNNKVTITGGGTFASLSGTYDYAVANQKITFSSKGLGITLNYSLPAPNQLLISNDQGASLLLYKK